jgi:magnesium transporter
MTVDWALYCDGQRQECDRDLTAAVEAADRLPGSRVSTDVGVSDARRVLDKAAYGEGPAGKAGFVWIDLVDPELADLERVAEVFHLHPLAVEDAFLAHQRPKMELYRSDEGDDCLFVILKTLRYVDETSDIKPAEVNVFLGSNYCVTVRHGKADPVAVARRRLESDQAEVLACGPTAVLYAVCDAVVDAYTAIARSISADIEDVEAAVFDERTVDARRGLQDPRKRKGTVNHAEVIYKLKREVLEFRRVARPLVEPLSQLADGGVPLADDEARPYFRDVHDHTLRVLESVDVFNTQLSDILNANLTQVSIRQNDDMRKISAWAAMVTVPTFIAGVYGMNFEHMPELSWAPGYPLALLTMVTICLLLHRAFKRSGWL